MVAPHLPGHFRMHSQTCKLLSYFAWVPNYAREVLRRHSAARRGDLVDHPQKSPDYGAEGSFDSCRSTPTTRLMSRFRNQAGG